MPLIKNKIGDGNGMILKDSCCMIGMLNAKAELPLLQTMTEEYCVYFLRCAFKK